MTVGFFVCCVPHGIVFHFVFPWLSFSYDEGKSAGLKEKAKMAKTK